MNPSSPLFSLSLQAEPWMPQDGDPSQNVPLAYAVSRFPGLAQPFWFSGQILCSKRGAFKEVDVDLSVWLFMYTCNLSSRQAEGAELQISVLMRYRKIL